MKSKLLYLAVFLVLLSSSFTFNEFGIKWMWTDHIQVPTILLSTSIVLIGLSFFTERKELDSEL